MGVKDILAVIGVGAIALLIFKGCTDDDVRSVPLTPEEQARIEYDKKHKEANKLYAYMQKRIPPAATNVKYIGYRWVTFYLADQCMVAQANARGNYSYLGIAATDESVCQTIDHTIPDFEFTTPNTQSGVQY